VKRLFRQTLTDANCRFYSVYAYFILQMTPSGPPQVIDSLPAPKPLNASKSAIEDFAVVAARHVGFFPGERIDPIVTNLGGQLVYQEMDDWLESESGSIVVRGVRDFTIYLSEFTGPLRDRFTIAHELGHYFLHSEMGKNPIRVARNGSTRVEWEANWFAASFLMPADVFREAAKRSTSSQYLAARFLVSVSAAEVRKKSLGIA
jgi:hypothetical protein